MNQFNAHITHKVYTIVYFVFTVDLVILMC